MSLFHALLMGIFILPAMASDPLVELKEIIESDREQNQKIELSVDQEGTSKVSKSQVIEEVLQRITNCESKNYTSDRQQDGEITTFAFTCKSQSNELVTSEVFVTNKNGRPELLSYQDMVMNSREMTPNDFKNIFLNSDIQTAPSFRPVSPGIRTLTTFAKVGVPVYLSFKTAKVLSPVRTDWQKHFIAGAIISGATILTAEGLIRAYNKRRGVTMSDVKVDLLTSLAGLVASIGAGITKELRDKQCKCGTPEVKDALYTAAGGFMVSATVAIPIELIFRSRKTHTKPVF